MKRFLRIILIILTAALISVSGCEERVKTNYSYGSVFVRSERVFLA